MNAAQPALLADIGCFWWRLVAAAQQTQEKTQEAPSPDAPVANPARPTVSTPATLSPVGYLQFETGILAAWQSPGAGFANQHQRSD